MGRYTTTLMEIIQSELQRNGFNEFVNNGELTFDNQEFAFIQKVLRFDDDVKKIVDETFFKGFRFNDERIDRYFKQAFTTRFLDREINRQTVEAFASLVLYECIIREDYIYTVFGNELYKYLENHVDFNSDEIQNQINEETKDDTQNETYNNTSKSNGSSVSDDREATTSLPQSEMNINVDNDVLTFADDNTITKNKTTNEDETDSNSNRDTKGNTKTNGTQDTTGNQKSLQKTYIMENLEKLYTMRERIFNDFDKKCFLHIW